jgi:DNA-binding NarL/FixJ family response regulator
MPIKVLVVDDQRLFRESLSWMLAQDQDIHVVGQAADGHEAFCLALEKRPDIILMDLDLPKMDGIQATRLILDRYPKVKILILSVYGDKQHIAMGLEAGAIGYIVKDVEHREFIQIIKQYGKGLPINSPFLTSSFAVKQGNGSVDFGCLTGRERQVIDLLVLGLNTQEIGDRLCISIKTVKTHLQRIYRKTGVKNRVELILCRRSRESKPLEKNMG